MTTRGHLTGMKGGETDPTLSTRGKALILAIPLGLGAIFGQGAVRSLLKDDSRPAKPAMAPTMHVEHVINEGDAMGMGIVEREIIEDSRGAIKLSPEELGKYLHTAVNPEVHTYQEPHDDILQLGELVVGNVPMGTPDGQQEPLPAPDPNGIHVG